MALIQIGGGELLGSRDATLGENPTASIAFMYRSDDGTDTETDALDQGWSDAPTTVHDLPKISRSVESLGGWTWRVTITYRPASNIIPPKPVAGDPDRTRISTTGATQNLKRSLATVASVKVAGLPDADFDQLINVTDDSIEGVDVVVPSWREVTTQYLTNAAWEAKKAAVYGLTGKVNSDAFRGFATGEVLFQGVDADQRPEDDVWEVTFTFEMRPNRTGIVVGDLPAFDQKGWEYAWFRTAPADGGAGITRKPTHAFIERVYESGAFAALGV